MNTTTDKHSPLINSLSENIDLFHPGFSVCCVIFGFHEGVLKLLLMHYKGFNMWSLPASLIYRKEDVDTAAYRIMYELTGLKDTYLQQFHLFGDYNRRDVDKKLTAKLFKEYYGLTITDDNWFFKRYVTTGYYALVDYSKVKLTPFSEGETLAWMDLNSGSLTAFDYQSVVDKALETIHIQLRMVPIGRELLPEKFTMTEIRQLYEAILGRPLDRRNFQRRLLSFGYIDELKEKRTGGAHKSPTLFSFNKEKYDLLMEQGLSVLW